MDTVLITVVAVVAIGAAGMPSAAAVAAPAGTGSGPVASDPARTGDGGGLSLPGLRAQSYRITLITGDVVTLTADSGGRYGVTVTAATRPDGSRPIIDVSNEGRRDSLYAIPTDVRPHLGTGLLDKELFNVAYLAANGYDDQASGQLPVIVTYSGPQSAAARSQAGAQALPGSTQTSTLESIGGAGLTVDKAATGSFWAAVTGGGTAATTADTRTLSGGVAKIWLDRKSRVALEQSVPQIGAPEAWAAGLDGRGTKIAVLDTGIDATHPDVASRLTASRSFVPAETVADGHGHGTHVAATVAGTGAASAGRSKGVAPAADLVVGKVLANVGAGQDSWIIEGMEWAAIEQDADVVSMSLGGGPSDGTDPLSQAVNDLTAATGALFVIAAGNAGPGRATVASPGAANAALTVGAVDKANALAGFSGRGPRVADYAIKPEITAPGVAITAARATGTAMGTPVDDRYTSANGTSMATPHVAGAAAVLVQQHPDWTADQLKAALVATAADGGYSVYEQGAGRVDLARAVRQQVQVSPATADFGFLAWPREDVPVDKVLTYSNASDRAVTLDLALSAATTTGTPVPDGVLTLDSPTVTVPAGGSATVTVTLDKGAVEPGLYTGSVVATADGGIQLRTPVGFQVEHQKHKVTANVVPRADADRCPSGEICAEFTTFSVFAVDGPEAGSSFFTFAPEFTVPAGTYSITAITSWFENHRRQTAYLFAPEVTVTGGTTVELDANDAKRVTVGTPQRTEVLNSSFQHSRSTTDGNWTYFFSFRFQLDHNFWVTPTKPVSKGEFVVSPHLVLGAPPVSISVLKPQKHVFHPQMLQYYREGGAFQFWSGTRELEVVDVGQGLAPDYATVDARDKLVLVHQIPGWAFGCYLREDQLRQAIDAGAAGVLFAGEHMETLFCGFPVGWSGLDFANPPPIPYAALPADETDILTGLLRGRKPVRLAVTGSPDTPFLYSIKPYWHGQVPRSPHTDAGRQNVAVLANHVHAEQSGRFDMAGFLVRGGANQLVTAPTLALSGPRVLTEYVGPLDATAVYLRTLFGVGDTPALGESVLTVIRDNRREDTHWRARPRSMGAVGLAPEAVAAGFGGPCAGCRQGDVFYPTVTLTTAQQDHIAGTRTDVGDAVKLYRDGQLLPQSNLFQTIAAYKLPPEAARYRLTWDLDGIHSDWRFTSGPVAKDKTPTGHPCWETLFGISRNPCRAEPLIFLGYDAGVDISNAVAHGNRDIRVRAYHQAPDAPAIAGLKLWTSTDDGRHWTEVKVKATRDGWFAGKATYPRVGADRKVSLRAEAWDAAGNRVYQTIDNAYTLRGSKPPRKDHAI